MGRAEHRRRSVLRAALVFGAAGAVTASWTNALARDGARRVVHIDSYHRGNEWNDRIAAAVVETLEAAGVQVRVFHLDTKRKPSEGDKQAAAARAIALIDEFAPQVVTLSDDNAVKYVLMPHFRDADLPFVFCGLNWDASVYDLPYRNATGMVEVSPIPQLVALLRGYTSGTRLGYLAEDTPTKHKEKAYHEELFGLAYHRAYFVDSFADWKTAFETAQREVDILLLLGVGALTDWDHAEARRLAERATAIPTGTDFAWLMPYALLGIGKLPEEQGRWAARAALQILDGVSPASIPVTHNTQGELLFNPRIARRLGIVEPPALARLVE
jgi:ABC-type uncharacterized transport system substrate-binding protein